MEHHKENGDMEGYKPDNDESGSGWFDWMGDWGMGGNNNDHNDDGDYYGGGSGNDYYGGSGDNMDYDDGLSFMDGFYEFLEFLGTEGEKEKKLCFTDFLKNSASFCHSPFQNTWNRKCGKNNACFNIKREKLLNFINYVNYF